MNKFCKIKNVIDYNKYCIIKYANSYLHQFDKKYGYVLYGYNCLNVKYDFAYWFKTKKEAIKKLELDYIALINWEHHKEQQARYKDIINK